MRIVRAKDYDDMSRKAAMIMAAQIAEKPDSILGLATGSTPIGLYKCLIKWYEEGALDFSAIRTWNLDEYEGLPRTNDQSYYYFMHENLFDHVNLPEGATHVLNGMNPDAEAECAAYDKAIEEAGGIDIQLLGLGHDGHIAFNEPQDDFPAGTHCVELNRLHHEGQKDPCGCQRQGQGGGPEEGALRSGYPAGSRLHPAVPSGCDRGCR